MVIEEKIIRRIKEIDWCSNCGVDLKKEISFDVEKINSWEEARRYYNQNIWENKTLEAKNDLTSFLWKNHNREFLNWNNLAKEARQIIEINRIAQ